jgi:hypothetical protein
MQSLCFVVDGSFGLLHYVEGGVHAQIKNLKDDLLSIIRVLVPSEYGACTSSDQISFSFLPGATVDEELMDDQTGSYKVYEVLHPTEEHGEPGFTPLKVVSFLELRERFPLIGTEADPIAVGLRFR